MTGLPAFEIESIVGGMVAGHFLGNDLHLRLKIGELEFHRDVSPREQIADEDGLWAWVAREWAVAGWFQREAHQMEGSGGLCAIRRGLVQPDLEEKVEAIQRSVVCAIFPDAELALYGPVA